MLTSPNSFVHIDKVVFFTPFIISFLKLENLVNNELY
jgi:hypothetical protein